MDRGKLGAKRPIKGKGHAPPGDFIPLGTKGDAKTSVSAPAPRKPSTSSSVSAPLKRESSSSTLVAKKPKLGPPTFTPLGRHGDIERRSSPTTQVYLYDEIAKEVETPSEFLDYINDAAEREDDERVEALLCGSVRYLKMNRSKPELSMSLGLLCLSKCRSSIFNSEVVIEAFCSLLKREVSLSFKTKGNPLVSVLACNTLLGAFLDEEIWPDTFIKVYMDDAMGERIWVDRADCKAFVQNVQSAFNTKMPKISALATDTKDAGPGTGTSSPVIVKVDDDDDSMQGMEVDKSEDEDMSSLVSPRYNYQKISIESYVLDILREQLSRRQSMDGGSRNLVRVMTATCGYSEVRTMAAQRLEMWLQNPKLTRPAQDLLMSVCMNCDQHTHQDIEVMNQLCKIRLKLKPLINHYLLCIRELLTQHPDNLRTLMAHTVHNELSNSRNPNNMALLSVMFNLVPDQSAKLLAEIFQDLLTNREEYLRGLRILLREIVRSVRQDMNFAEFALGLMKERTEAKFTDGDPATKERLFMSLTDLITLTALLGVSPAVKESASAVARGDQKATEVLHSFQRQMAIIQKDAVSWLHTVAPKMFDIKQNEYVHCLRKILFMEMPEHYTKVDNWPPENDRSTMLRLVAEVPVLEDTLLRILIMGLTREVPVNATDAIELVDQLIRRASIQISDDFQVLVVERVDVIDLLLNLCTYRHPENIVLPKGYKPPTLAITNLYWKAWTIMLIISAFNPSRIGFAAWENYPMLKCLMEMVMTRNFKFPPPTMATDDKTVEEIKNREKQVTELEKQQILEFEGHLAAATSKKQITDSNSLLLSQLTTMDPSGSPRRPPQQLLDQLEILNKNLSIGHLLCRSRNPDFLLDIIHRQGTSQSMPWLAELVESNESSLDVLPVQCLCEFLLHDVPDSLYDRDDDDDGKLDRQKRKQKQRKQQQLLGRLQTLLHSSTSDARTICEVLGYFLKRLSSQGRANRLLAVKGLSMVLAKDQLDVQIEEPMDVDENPAVTAIPTHRWLLDLLPSLPQFTAIKPQACADLRQACQIETDSAAVSAYIVFLSHHTTDLLLQELDELALDLAQLIVERATLMNHLLPQEGMVVNRDRADFVLASMINLFYGYLIKAQEPEKEAYSWSNTQDQILLQWESGKSATINVLVVHAMIILLTYSEPKVTSHYREMSETWFPVEGSPPSAYLVDTSEEALLLPDWLKLRMIRSSNERLVDAALVDLEPSQLLLFVQSFGIPVASMSKLFTCLDQAVAQDSYAMEQVVVDKGYMAQLVQVQHMRGALGGNRFYALLSPGGLEQLPTPKASQEEDLVPSRRKRTMSQIAHTPVLSDVQRTSPQHMICLLCQVFGIGAENQSLPQAERANTFKTLQKSLSSMEVCHTVSAALLELIISKDRAAFVSSLKMSLHFSCPILRLLIINQDFLGDSLPKFMSLLAKALEGSKSTISNIVAQYHASRLRTTQMAIVSQELGVLKTKVKDSEDVLKTDHSKSCFEDLNIYICKAMDIEHDHSQSGNTSRTMNMLMRSKSKEPVHMDGSRPANYGQKYEMVVSDTVLWPPTMLSVKTNPRAENFINVSMSDSVKVQNVEERSCTVIESLQASDILPKSTVGLLVDWFQLLDPEVIAHISELQQECLFVKQSSDGITLETRDFQPMRSPSVSCQPYLLALLTHQTNWNSLHKCVELVLSKNKNTGRLSATAALDFLHACIYIPKIWQGRDKKIPKNSILEDILMLTTDQIQRVTAYILSEASSNGHDDHVTLSQRIQLLLRCCCSKNHLLKAVVEYLNEAAKKEGRDVAASQQLLLELYVQVPDIVDVHADCLMHQLDGSVTQKGISQLDALSHRIICTLGNAYPGKESENKMYDANIACRKLASQHPLLVLRQLPMISALLQSRAQFSFGEVKHRNHLLLYTHVLGMLELLQPYVFHKEYHKTLESVFKSFFDLIRLHGMRNRQLGSVIMKFIKLLNNFMAYNTTQAGLMLHPYLNILNDLTNPYPDLPQLRELLAGLTLPRRDEETKADEAEGSKVTICDPNPPRPSSPVSMTHLAPYLSKLAKGSTNEVLSVLQELDETSKRKLDILQYFSSDLCRLLSVQDDQCRNTAHNLVMRYVRHDPGSAGEFVPAIIQCLENSNIDVVNSVLKNLAEFTLLAQEYSSKLLLKAFKVGVFNKVDCTSYISDAIQLLNMETMT